MNSFLNPGAPDECRNGVKRAEAFAQTLSKHEKESTRAVFLLEAGGFKDFH